MSYAPNFEDFCEQAKKGNLIPLSREVLADMETPVSAFNKLKERDCAVLLESVEGGEKWARYSFLACDPLWVFSVKNGELELSSAEGVRKEKLVGDPLELLSSLLEEYKPVDLPGLPRFTGGAIGYVGYECVSYFEKVGRRSKKASDLPEMLFMLFADLLVFDNALHKIKLIANVSLPAGASKEQMREHYLAAQQRIDGMLDILRAVDEVPALDDSPEAQSASFSSEECGHVVCDFKHIAEVYSNLSTDDYKKMVRKGVEYIKAGDLIQVVLSQRFQTKTTASAFEVYRALRTINPSPYMFFFKCKELQLVGSSPEVMARVEGDALEVRPIAGTRRRGESAEEEEALRVDLLNDEKERAEHIMLVDLGRNDVGRVSETGSVCVSELMEVEKYSHVMHLVSTVRGRLKKECSAFDAFRSCFPAGTLSGAPKIRAIEIIDELENSERGVYGGALGWFSFSGDMDTCIVIRTVVYSKGVVSVQAGAGIVADSSEELEYEETINKARGMFRALALAEEGLN